MELKGKKRIFMKPGRTNQEDRDNFIKFWVSSMKELSDEEWSSQQNILINSQLHGADHETYLKIHNLKNQILRMRNSSKSAKA